jgi:hypothetical protein
VVRSASPSLICVLGHPRVLDEGAPDPARRVVERRSGRVAGAAAYEKLYGPAAEIAVSVEDAEDLELVRTLVHAIAARVAEADLRSMHVAVQAGQEPLVAAVLGAPVVDGTASVRIGSADGSVIPTDGEGQGVPMTRVAAAPILDP